ncbi:MAG: CBS domain-containing protein [Chloroflexi bacterium]|nr:CBS domain-containing protein [Chloroflexota bacterium]
MSGGNALRLGRILGVEIKLDYSWFIIFVLVTVSLSGQIFPSLYAGWSRGTYWLLGALTSVLFFTSVLAHELAHSLVSQAYGVPVHDITLFIFGGAAHIDEEPKTARAELLMALAGPGTSLVISALFGLFALLSRSTSPHLGAIGTWLAGINASLAAFNLIPGFPLDGGRVFRALVWGLTGNLQRATQFATGLGRLIAFGFVLLGVWQLFIGNWVNGLWIAFIGWFLDSAAASSYRRFTLRHLLAGHTAREVMTSECTLIPRHLTLDVFVEQIMLPSGRRCFPVQEGGRIRGLLTLHRIREVPRERWSQTRVDDIMIPWAELKSVRPDEELNTVFDRMAAEDVNQLPVIEGDSLLGMVARDNLLAFIHQRTELGL